MLAPGGEEGILRMFYTLLTPNPYTFIYLYFTGKVALSYTSIENGNPFTYLQKGYSSFFIIFNLHNRTPLTEYLNKVTVVRLFEKF